MIIYDCGLNQTFYRQLMKPNIYKRTSPLVNDIMIYNRNVVGYNICIRLLLLNPYQILWYS